MEFCIRSPVPWARRLCNTQWLVLPFDPCSLCATQALLKVAYLISYYPKVGLVGIYMADDG